MPSFSEIIICIIFTIILIIIGYIIIKKIRVKKKKSALLRTDQQEIEQLIAEKRYLPALKNLENLFQELLYHQNEDIEKWAIERVIRINKIASLQIEDRLQSLEKLRQREVKEDQSKFMLRESDIQLITQMQGILEYSKKLDPHSKEMFNKMGEYWEKKMEKINNLRRILIKNTILDLGGKFSRLQVSEIAGFCNAPPRMIISTIKTMIENEEIHAQYFNVSRSIAFDQQANIEEINELMKSYEEWEKMDGYEHIPLRKEGKFLSFSRPTKPNSITLYLGYSTSDSNYFKIQTMVEKLNEYPEIKQIIHNADFGEIKFSEKDSENVNTFILFCSKNFNKESQSMEEQWAQAFQLRKEGKMKIIPVYDEDDHIPFLLTPLLNVEFLKDDFDQFIKKLYLEILR